MIPSTQIKSIGWIGDAMKKSRAIEMIKNVRHRKGISSFKAAEDAGINQSTWSRTENNMMSTSWDVILKMSKAVGLEATITIRDGD
jgi:transcriptional regulator with XRE-family HTH domain